MPSSTSSSDPSPREIPAGDWRGTWLVAIALAAALVWRLEAATRAHGQRASITDDELTWSLARRTVDDDARVVAFVGSSRLQLAYSARAFADAAPGWRGGELAINGVKAPGILDDLADDEHFHGLAVVDLVEWDFGGDDANDARSYVTRFHDLWHAPGAAANRSLAELVQTRLAILAVGGRAFITALVHRDGWPPPHWLAYSRQREGEGDFALVSPKLLAARRASWPNMFPAPIAPDAWLAAARARIEPAIAKIRAHGGDVAIIHPPISGSLAAGFDARFPRARYWDAFARSSPALVLHFRDLPGMRDLVCPDDMHLDDRDRPAFTTSLVAALREHGLLTPAAAR